MTDFDVKIFRSAAEHLVMEGGGGDGGVKGK